MHRQDLPSEAEFKQRGPSAAELEQAKNEEEYDSAEEEEADLAQVHITSGSLLRIP